MDHDSLKEKIPHGDAMLPLMVHVFETDVCLQERIVSHWHAELEFLVVTQGCADFHIDAENYRVQKGDLLFVNTNRLHSATAVAKEPFCFFAVVFSPSLLGNYGNDGIWQKYVEPVLHSKVHFPEHIRPQENWEQEVLALLTQIQNIYLQQETAYELLLKAKLYEMWYLLFAHSQFAQEATRLSDYRIVRIKAVLNYIQEHYRQKITLAELAAEFQMSEGQFCRFFRSMINLSAVEYINSCRISESGVLLQETDKEIGEIAGLVGFNNISYFNKTFRKYMHCSPTQFRQNGKRSET